MKKLTKRQRGIVAGAVAVAIGSVTPLVVREVSGPVPDFVDPYFAGAPVSTNQWTVLTNRTYIVAYDPATKNPAWVAYRLHWPETFVGPKRPSGFRKDRRLNSSIGSDDYTNTGYDRGHLAPSYGIGVCYGKWGQRETFLMSNVAPQTPGMNRGPWRLLEETAVKLWTYDSTVWVVTGPVYDEDCGSLPAGVKVPSAFFKVFAKQASSNAPPYMVAFVVPQRVMMKDPFTNFVVSVNDVEKITGIDFFSALPDDLESIVESERRLW